MVKTDLEVNSPHALIRSSNSTEVKINLSTLYENVPQDADGYEVYCSHHAECG